MAEGIARIVIGTKADFSSFNLTKSNGQEARND